MGNIAKGTVTYMDAIILQLLGNVGPGGIEAVVFGQDEGYHLFIERDTGDDLVFNLISLPFLSMLSDCGCLDEVFLKMGWNHRDDMFHTDLYHPVPVLQAFPFSGDVVIVQ